jgi:hypothetical protein
MHRFRGSAVAVQFVPSFPEFHECGNLEHHTLTLKALPNNPAARCQLMDDWRTLNTALKILEIETYIRQHRCTSK